MRTNVLITGANGYLAGPLALHLAKKLKNHNIILGSRNVDVLKSVIALEKFEKRYFNICDTDCFEESLYNVEVVIHLAGMGARACAENPELAEFVNVAQLESFLIESYKSCVKKIIYFSTVHVYGALLSGDINESQVANPQSIYAKTHLRAENVFSNFLKQKMITGFILRLANVISLPMTKEGEFSGLIAISACKSAIAEGKIVLNSSGEDLRDFISLELLGDIVVKSIEQQENINGNFIFNVASGKTIKVIDLIKKIQRQCSLLYGFEPILQVGTLKENRENFFNIDTSLAATTFGINHRLNKYDLEQPLSEILEFYNLI